MLEFLGPVLDSLGLIPGWEMVPMFYICVLNCDLDVVREMTMDFGSIEWNRCLVRRLPTDSPLHGCGIVKNSPGLLVGLKMVHVCCKQNIA